MIFDYLVIGSGIAGLCFALKAAEKSKVCIVTKKSISESNTYFAQGGIASVIRFPDNFNKHIEDTIKIGCGLNRREIVEMVIKQAPERINDLINWGVCFDKDEKGNFDLNKEGGHSEPRVLHYKDKTGYYIQNVLTERVKNNPNITILEYHFAIEVITQHHLGYKVKRGMPDIECYGAYVHDVLNNKIIKILAKITVIATGGIGNIYYVTTNPEIATGDGIAMCYRAKAECADMEFIQFHPTTLYNPVKRPAFLISEALRGAGAKLKTIDGYYFMKDYDSREELAPRDIVARAIDSVLKKTGDEYVLLDATHIDERLIKSKFPNIFKECLKAGYNITKEPIPVVPAAHYICGGIKTDEHGKTTINNLYAIGECACTGLHGANRLASNSLLEAIVFAHNAFIHSISYIDKIKINYKIPDWNEEGTSFPKEMIIIKNYFKELQMIMSNYVGIIRSNERLNLSLNKVNELYIKTEEIYKKTKISPHLCELRNAINVAYLIIKFALNRKENIGLHYNIDNVKN
ncbi:MAG: L-aspartate oxidase [Bacteroidales bacterium]|nr:L-aspartate oxidase [Bacteroidales bacterium]